MLENWGLGEGHTRADLIQRYERQAGITTWEMVPEPGRTIEDKEACLGAAVEFVRSKGLELFRSFGFSFQVTDPDDTLDDEAMSRHIEEATGLTTEWYPHRASDAPDPEPDPLETLKTAGRMTIDVPSAEEVIEANERRRKLFAVNMRSLLYT